jgi:hypothetical protein
MPLPDGGTPWPPPEHRDAYDRYRVHAAWYSGDPDNLADVYRGINWLGDSTDRNRLLNRPSQYRGGIIGRLSRWFWGAPVPAGERRTKLHVPVAADIARASATQLFSEPPTFGFAEGPKSKIAVRFDTIATGSKLHASLLSAAEVDAGLGDVYLRIVWDTDLRDYPWLDVVHADAAIPEWRWGVLRAVTFHRVLQADDRTVVRWLERHEPGSLEHAVYKGTAENLGQPDSLEAYEATRGLDAQFATGTNRLTAVHIPNVLPNRQDRGSCLGRSDYAGVEGNMDALDETYTSWMRDVRLGKARILAPDSMLRALGPGQGAVFEDRELYQGLNALVNPDKPGGGIEQVQFAIRWQEHRETMAEHLQIILRSAGYSLQTFGGKGDIAVTATEVNAREGLTAETRGMKQLHWKAGLAEISETLLAVDATLFSSGVTPESPDVTFGDSVQEDPKVLAETADLLHRAEAASTDTLVRMVHPDWDDDKVTAEVARIRNETSTAVPNPDEFGPGQPNGQDPDTPESDTGGQPNG